MLNCTDVHHMLRVWARSELMVGSVKTITAQILDGKGRILPHGTAPNKGPSISFLVCHIDGAIRRLTNEEQAVVAVYYLGTGPVSVRARALGMRGRKLYIILERAKRRLGEWLN